MAYPKAYNPVQAYRFQLFARNRLNGRAWVHLSYAVDKEQMQRIFKWHRYKRGASWQFRAVKLPIIYWPK